MRVCAIGTSHLAALKSGWDMVAPEFPGVEMTFFGSPGASLRHLKMRGARLVPSDAELEHNLAWTSGGKTEIVVPDYDVLLLYGLNLGLPRLHCGFSTAVALATAADLGQKGLCQMTAAKLRKITRRAIWIAPSPLETAPGDQHEARDFHGYDRHLAAMAAGFPVEGTRFLPQPPETIGPDLRAPARFGVGSLRLLPMEGDERQRPHPEDDTKHMNGDYGALWLRLNLPAMLSPEANAAKVHEIA